jgi:hypothetical protein
MIEILARLDADVTEKRQALMTVFLTSLLRQRPPCH